MIKIGEKIRKLRMQRLFTLQKLADLTDLSKGYISQIENNQTSPSLKKLEEILEVLGYTLSEFFAPTNEVVKIIKREEHIITNVDDDQKCKITKIMPDSSHFVDIDQVEIEPFGISKIYPTTSGEITIHCLESQVTLVRCDKRYLIKKGDTAIFPGNESFRLENNKNSKTKVFVVITPPNLGGDK